MSRKLAREAAFKALFQLEFNFESDRRKYFEDLAINTMFNDNPKLTQKDLIYIESTVKGTREHLESIDDLIADNLKEGWTLARIMTIDKNILRLIIYEMRFSEPNLSKSIAINEAVELAKRYGTDDSSRFINGLLDKISK